MSLAIDTLIDASNFQRHTALVAVSLFEVSELMVRKIAQEAGFEFSKKDGRGKGKWLTAATRKGIIKALKANPSAATHIAAQFEVSEPIVRKIARDADIAPPPKPRFSGEKRSAIIEALMVNPNASQTARQIGNVSAATVHSIAKGAGIKLTVGRPRLAETRAKAIRP